MAALDKYPYGCTEQITSRALPLVYLDDVVLAAGLTGQKPVRERVQTAIGDVLVNQGSNGSFGLWSPGSEDLWLDAYVTDFLTRAKEKGYDVPAVAFDLAVTNLKNRVAYSTDFTTAARTWPMRSTCSPATAGPRSGICATSRRPSSTPS